MRRRWKSSTRLLAALMTATIVAVVVSGVGAIARQPDRGTSMVSGDAAAKWDRFEADLLFRRMAVDDESQPVSKAPTDVRYHLIKERNGAHWRTTFVRLGASAVQIQSRTGPYWYTPPNKIERIVNEGDGSPLKFLSADGRQLDTRLPLLSARGINGGGPSLNLKSEVLSGGITNDGYDWAKFVVLREDAATRVAEIKKEFGASREQLRGLDRYTKKTGDTLTEVLVDPVRQVIVERNEVVGRELVSHEVSVYADAGGSAVVRQKSRIERALMTVDLPKTTLKLPKSPAERAALARRRAERSVVEISIDKIQFIGGGQ